MIHPVWWGRVIDEMNAYQLANPANLPGAVFAAETLQDGRLVTSVGNGWTNNTICNIGSMTKAFTATAVLLALEEHDLLEVEKPVWQLPGMGLYAHDPLRRQIKIRHLLQHATGMPVFERYFNWPETPCNNPKGGLPCCADPSIYIG